MCLAIYVAANELLAPPYVPEAMGIEVRRLTADEALSFCAFSKPQIYAVRMPGSCGCEFRHPNGIPRQALAWLLDWAIQTVQTVELFVCWEGDEGMTPLQRDWTSATELRVWREFEPGDLLVVQEA